MKLTYIQQSGSPPVGDGGDQYTGLDRFGRVVDQRWMKESSGADLERVEYGFDRASNRVWRDNPVADALNANQDEFYTYDRLNQLLTLQRGTLNSGKTGISRTPTWEEDFTIDPTGNWDNYVNQVNGTTTLNQPRTHNAVNEVETISGSSSLMQQNAAGNMSKAPKPMDWSSAYAMTYDAWQRLVKVKSGSTTVAIYAYDGQNRRTTKTTGTTLRHYYYSSQWQILEERLNTATSADRQFVWGLMGLDNLILRDRGTERFYSLQDVFSCTAIVDTSGTVQERYGYNAFGLSRVMDASFNVISASSYDWETRYDNYRFDAESNFYQVRNRYLHPTLGRWLTRDPIEYDGGINLYAYVNNWAINQIDELGLQTNAPQKTCCCCADKIKITNVKTYDDPTRAGNDFDVPMELSYKESKTSCDCTLEWNEKTNIPYTKTMKPNEWNNMFQLIPDSVTFDPWNKRTKPCVGKESPVIHDIPGLGKTPGRTVTRTLEFNIVVTSATGCKCDNNSVSVQAKQVLVMINGSVDFSKSSFTVQ